MFNARAWRRLYEAAQRDRAEHRFWEDVQQDIRQGGHTASDYSIRELFENFVEDGREVTANFSPRLRNSGETARILEAVDTGAFANITGQIVYSRVLEAFNNPVFLADRLATTVPTEFSGEKIPGITQIGDEAEVVGEGENYPMAGVSEEWVETPETTKRGFILGVTKEAIFFDRTGVLMQRASNVAEQLAINKEKRVLQAATGVTTLYRRNGASAVATYGDNSGAHDWDNLQASNALVDWTDIENALLLFDGMTDPNTGEPIVLNANAVLVPSALVMTARRIVSATEVHYGDYSAASYQTLSANPLNNPISATGFEILSNQWVKSVTSSATTWFIGDFRSALFYMQNWPITVQQAPPNSEAEFSQDIVSRYKVSERGTPAMIEPRRLVKNTA